MTAPNSELNKDILHNPLLVDDLGVYFITPDTANVIDHDSRYELTATKDSCDCCTFRFSSGRNPGFRCRHIKAVRKVLGLPE